ncbi:hypothetical protein Pmar_PMAR006254 [Perkinsus marinus ATCC 50983]|uniref:Uncharacterized protein n=1 Tax=Perkinsus marinus (strain ATCC 50983 / TXsc) TaxID=423536 RepID=C5LAI8_PERM5|nr:hypothetical protein Pmar_PMAR006254 [Perkinsus marinus ATCC 50983]EER06444.1 hypothetical protein Pmar_PMAR006254 [Perkinsus marinus ATCC 50983]|eukprot:XP_002774628.1 hypothetical protein Pmar_PMAR006254 [Perkinsus marinus ATCC 50983]
MLAEGVKKVVYENLILPGNAVLLVGRGEGTGNRQKRPDMFERSSDGSIMGITTGMRAGILDTVVVDGRGKVVIGVGRGMIGREAEEEEKGDMKGRSLGAIENRDNRLSIHLDSRLAVMRQSTGGKCGVKEEGVSHFAVSR